MGNKFDQRKFRNLTSDYTELLLKIFQPRDAIAQMRYSRDVRHEDLAGRKCAKCCVFPRFCGFAGWESQLLRTGGRGGSAAEDAAKFAPRLRTRAVRKSKSLKTESLGRLLEVGVAKICTTTARESDLEIKIVKN